MLLDIPQKNQCFQTQSNLVTFFFLTQKTLVLWINLLSEHEKKPQL